jgi:hypothetical protein
VSAVNESLASLSPSRLIGNAVRPPTISDRALLILFYGGVFFPFLRVTPWPTDIQPLALACAVGVLACVTRPRMPRTLGALVSPFVASIALLTISTVDFASARAIGNYASVSLLAIASYYVVRKDPPLALRAIEVSIYAWFVVGLIQIVISRDFGTWLIAAARTSGGRGVVGLAVEPTMYGLICLLMLALTRLTFQGKKRLVLSALLVLQTIVFAQSTMSLLLLFVWGALSIVVHLFSRRGLGRTALVAVVCGIAGAAVLPQILDEVRDRRIVSLTRLIARNPGLAIAADRSAAERLSSIIVSVKGFADGWGRPHGFSAYSDFSAAVVASHTGSLPLFAGSSRTMSGYGSALFELGWFALVIPLVVSTLVWSAHPGDRRSAATMVVFVNLILLTAIPLATPTIGFLLGHCAVLRASARTSSSSVAVAGPAALPAMYGGAS